MSRHPPHRVTKLWDNYQQFELVRVDHSIMRIDYCGPFLIRDKVRRNSKRYKAYVAVFVCMVTKAVHLELVEAATSAAFIGALNRFISRRGNVVNMYSNNGKNFLGADNELKRLFQDTEFNADLQNAATEARLTWHFIPPKLPISEDYGS